MIRLSSRCRIDSGGISIVHALSARACAALSAHTMSCVWHSGRRMSSVSLLQSRGNHFASAQTVPPAACWSAARPLAAHFIGFHVDSVVRRRGLISTNGRAAVRVSRCNSSASGMRSLPLSARVRRRRVAIRIARSARSISSARSALHPIILESALRSSIRRKLSATSVTPPPTLSSTPGVSANLSSRSPSL
jgi:hypothetical protein